MIFADIELAQRIERAEMRLSVSIGDAAHLHEPGMGAFVAFIGSGAAVYAGPGSPANKIIGVGFGEPPDVGQLGELERAYCGQNCPVQAEISTLASPAVLALFTARGYLLQGFENVLGRELTEADLAPAVAGDIDIEPVSVDARSAWADVVLTAFEHGDDTGAGSGVAPPTRRAIERAYEYLAGIGAYRTYIARSGGVPAGGAALRIDGEIGQLCGAATLPMYRCRGIQGALLRYRLREARLSGCGLAVMTAQPGSRSHFNAQRQGFSLLYSRTTLVKDVPQSTTPTPRH